MKMMLGGRLDCVVAANLELRETAGTSAAAAVVLRNSRLLIFLFNTDASFLHKQAASFQAFILFIRQKWEHHSEREELRTLDWWRKQPCRPDLILNYC